MKKEKMNERGKRIKAGKLLSSFIRAIAEEETEFLKGKDGSEDRMVSKAEALVRSMWKRALGYTETIIEDGKESKRTYPPDK